MTDEHELIVINNATYHDYKMKNREECDKLGIKCVEFDQPPNLNAGDSHGFALDKTLEVYARHNNDLVFLVDFDLFPIEKISIKEELLKDNQIFGIAQSKKTVSYLWPGFLIFDVPKMPQFETISLKGGSVEGCNVDTGGKLHNYTKQHPEIKVRQIRSGYWTEDHPILQRIEHKYIDEYQSWIIEDKFFHYGRGSNWDRYSKDFIDKKNDASFELMDTLLKE